MQIENQAANVISKSVLLNFEPIARLSPNRLDELAPLCIVEQVSKDLDPTRLNGSMQALYLIKGEMGIRYYDGRKEVLRAGTEAAKFPVDVVRLNIQDTVALTPLEIVRIDLDLLDIMMTWDQLSGYPPAEAKKSAAISQPASFTGNQDTGSFHAFQVHNGAFSSVPAANIEAMFARMTSVDVNADQVIITQGQEGDYYYLIQQGTAIVSRIHDVSKPSVVLAEITEGNGFGEEALASDNKRNATVTMKTNGQLLRLKKEDFVELLKAPLVNSVNKQIAESKVASGAAVWLDIRFPSEFKHEHIDGAINAPLHELRSHIAKLDKAKEHIVYCQTGRRSSAAAFILAQFGLKAVVLEGGTRSN